MTPGRVQQSTASLIGCYHSVFTSRSNTLSQAASAALIPQTQIGSMKPIIKTDYASADEETVVIFKENQFKPFWCMLCLVHTWIETQWINDLWWTSDREESHSSLRRNVFRKVQWIWMFWSESTGKYLLYCATMSQLLVKPTMCFKCQECCQSPLCPTKGNPCLYCTSPPCASGLGTTRQSLCTPGIWISSEE